MGNTGNYSMEDVKRIANSDAAKKLIAMLQETDRDGLSKAMQQASTGNFEQAKSTLSALMSSPEAQDLINQLGG